MKETYVFRRSIGEGSSKTVRVPGDRFWELMWAHLKYTAGALPNLRLIQMRIMAPGDEKPIARYLASTVQQGQTVMRYQFFPAVADRSAMYWSDVALVPCPAHLVLMPGWILHFEDRNGVDVTDHLELRALVAKESKE